MHRRIYFKKSEAIKLGREWRKVLLWKNLPIFGCPNVRTAVVHSLISPRLSADVATRMIAIIKRRALANQTERMIGQRDGGIGSTTTASSQAGQSRHYN